MSPPLSYSIPVFMKLGIFGAVAKIAKEETMIT
jgi:hypothetical protein